MRIHRAVPAEEHENDLKGWDNIDIFSWLGYPMQIKVDFLRGEELITHLGLEYYD